jgi:hypothetical protein
MVMRRQSDVERRSGKDRRRGVDSCTEEEKTLVGERRTGTVRRSGLDRGSDTASASTLGGGPKKV